MTDEQLVFYYLKRIHDWVNVIDIMQALKPTSRNWAVRSRISNINERANKGKLPAEPKIKVIDSRQGNNGCADYKYIGTDEYDPYRKETLPIKYDSNNQGVFF